MSVRDQLQRSMTMMPPWILIGAAVVMLPVVALMAREHLDRQKRSSVALLTEKGAALIRSFEAGARHGMMGMGGDRFRLQHLLMETAKQPDIIYLTVTESDGRIIAHSDSRRIGGRHDFPGAAKSGEEPDTLSWRQWDDGDGRSIFEVYRSFNPIHGAGAARGRHSRRMMGGTERPLGDGPDGHEKMIFIGLDMTPVLSAQKADFQHTLFMGALVLLIGFSGIVLLLMAQSFQATRTSLSRVRAFSDSVVEHLPVGLIALTDERRVATLNPAGASILGLSDRDVVGKPAEGIIPDALLAIIDALADQSIMIAREIECPIPGDRQLPLEVSASLLQDDAGRPLGSIILFADIAEMVALRGEVARSQRLASIGHLAAGVAHEVRNPLSSIKGFATVFKERYRDVPTDQETAALMIQEVDRLNRVVTQLLDFSRPVAVNRATVHPGAALEDTKRLIEERADRQHVSIRTDLDPALGPVKTDPDQIRQVLLNLCLNGLDAMPDGGQLSLSAVRSTDGDGCRFMISDTGVGISEEDIGGIFDPYFTTKRSGTGLGLAIVHHIVDALGGVLHVKSRSGEGTTVTFSINSIGDNHGAADPP
ncbi:MAG: ATP-binding protein [Desulfobacterales bacterium]|jgi:two-component system sensor histidine kinase HydH